MDVQNVTLALPKDVLSQVKAMPYGEKSPSPV